MLYFLKFVVTFIFFFQVTRKEVQKLTFTVPLKEPLPNQYFVQYLSDRWQGSTGIQAIPLSDLILPERHPPHTGKSLSQLTNK